jgi:hypothetical protein
VLKYLDHTIDVDIQGLAPGYHNSYVYTLVIMIRRPLAFVSMSEVTTYRTLFVVTAIDRSALTLKHGRQASGSVIQVCFGGDAANTITGKGTPGGWSMSSSCLLFGGRGRRRAAAA